MMLITRTDESADIVPVQVGIATAKVLKKKSDSSSTGYMLNEFSAGWKAFMFTCDEIRNTVRNDR